MNNPFTLLENRLDRIEKLLNEVKQPKKEDKLLSKKEATILLGITLNTLDKHIKNGTIPAYGLGSRLMFKRDEVINSLTKIN